MKNISDNPITIINIAVYFSQGNSKKDNCNSQPIFPKQNDQNNKLYFDHFD